MANLKVKISSEIPTTTLIRDYERSTSSKYPTCQAIADLISSILAGGIAQPIVYVTVEESEVKATGTITLSNTGAANDTLVINGVTFTAVASGATGNQWNVGGTATLSAAAIAAAFNASATALVNTQITATSALGVVTISAVNRGYAGNAVTIAKGVDAGTVMTVSGARLTGGVPDSSAKTYSF